MSCVKKAIGARGDLDSYPKRQDGDARSNLVAKQSMSLDILSSDVTQMAAVTSSMTEKDPRREYIRYAIVHALGAPADWVRHRPCMHTVQYRGLLRA